MWSNNEFTILKLIIYVLISAKNQSSLRKEINTTDYANTGYRKENIWSYAEKRIQAQQRTNEKSKISLLDM